MPAASPSGASREQGEEPQSRSWRRLHRLILSSLEDSKAEDIVSIELDPSAALADVMVVASGRSSKHVGAVAERLLDDMRKHGIRPLSVEGLEAADWVLIDFGDVIVHVFRPEVRALYNLEKLWSPHAPRQH
jgi:ribosome-associated protein